VWLVSIQEHEAFWPTKNVEQKTVYNICNDLHLNSILPCNPISNVDFKGKWLRKSEKFSTACNYFAFDFLHSFWDSSKKCAENQWGVQNKSQAVENKEVKI